MFLVSIARNFIVATHNAVCVSQKDKVHSKSKGSALRTEWERQGHFDSIPILFHSFDIERLRHWQRQETEEKKVFIVRRKKFHPNKNRKFFLLNINNGCELWCKGMKECNKIDIFKHSEFKDKMKLWINWFSGAETAHIVLVQAPTLSDFHSDFTGSVIMCVEGVSIDVVILSLRMIFVCLYDVDKKRGEENKDGTLEQHLQIDTLATFKMDRDNYMFSMCRPGSMMPIANKRVDASQVGFSLFAVKMRALQKIVYISVLLSLQSEWFQNLKNNLKSSSRRWKKCFNGIQKSEWERHNFSSAGDSGSVLWILRSKIINRNGTKIQRKDTKWSQRNKFHLQHLLKTRVNSSWSGRERRKTFFDLSTVQDEKW